MGLWGVGLWSPPKSTIKFVCKPRSMQPPHTPEAPPLPESLLPPRVPKMVRPNKYTCPVVCVVVRYALFFTLIFASLSLIFRY